MGSWRYLPQGLRQLAKQPGGKDYAGSLPMLHPMRTRELVSMLHVSMIHRATLVEGILSAYCYNGPKRSSCNSLQLLCVKLKQSLKLKGVQVL